MSIFASAVGPTNQPVTVTSATGTGIQVISGTLLSIGPNAALYSGKPFHIIAQGYVKSHGASQTIAIGLQGQKGSATFSGTQLATLTASGQMIAGTVYPWYIEYDASADNVSGILTGDFWGFDGITPTKTAQTVSAATLSGVNFGSFNVGTNVTNPLAAAQTVALQFALTFTNTVSDTVETVSITSFYAGNDN